MREEIAAAVVFVTRLIKLNDSIPKEKLEEFSTELSSTLVEKFKNHWYDEQPSKGQGYRCIRINPLEPTDPAILKAASQCGLQYNDLNLPQELSLTLWVDPKEVCCRFGESHGSFCQLAVQKEDGNMENQAHTINIEDLVKQQQQRFNMNLNITTTRTSANKLKALAMKNAFNQQANGYHYYSKYHHNAMNNNQHQNGHTPRPFHKTHHHNHQSHYHKNAPHHSSSVNSHERKGSGDFNGVSGNVNGAAQGKDRYRWVRNSKPMPAQQTESMRLSPN
ncbi:BTG3-like protein [Mya arenaria]|uniref:BTG3-like protein n=1 Tax=Mya arenaria TaxID=6604 RepID=A0ABY7E6N2_MYAAR|nr:protein BTG1-like [Mya arenaria]WAR04844.1 BTG3-like protein [Mya arenaria]